MALTKATFSMIDGAYTNVKDYNAVGNGSTDDTDAIKAAVAAAVAANNTLFFPSGTYLCNGLIGNVACNLLGISFVDTKIQYTGTSANFINFNGTNGQVIENISFQATNAAHAAYFTKTAASFQSFNNCQWVGPSNPGAGCLLYMNGAINIEINGCFFTGHHINLIGQDGGGSGFCNGVGISNTLFANYKQGAVANGGQAWSFDQVLFEHGVDNLVYAVYTDTACIWYGTSFTGCWLGDQTGVGPASMIKWKGYGLSIAGNYINGSGYLDTYIVELTGTSKGINITGNYGGGFAGILNASTYASDVFVAANNLNPATIEVNGTVGGLLLNNAKIQTLNVFFTPQSLPASGTAEGQTVYDSGTKKLFCWNGTTWNALF